LADALDAARPNRSGEQATMADALEAARQDMQEKSADELGGVEHHGRSRGRFVHGSSSSLGWFGFDFSVFVSVGRYFAVGSENGERETRVKDAKHWRSRRARSARP